MEALDLPASPRLTTARARRARSPAARATSPRSAFARSSPSRADVTRRTPSPAPFGDKCNPGYKYVKATTVVPKTLKQDGTPRRSYTRRAYCTPRNRGPTAWTEAVRMVFAGLPSGKGKGQASNRARLATVARTLSSVYNPQDPAGSARAALELLRRRSM